VDGADSIVSSVWQAAARHPQRCALKDGDLEISYAELVSRCEAVARGLRASGLCPGDRVALILPNCVGFVVAWYGTMLAGGVAVLLNAAAKARDFTTWLAHSEAKFLVCDPSNQEAQRAVERLPATVAPTLLAVTGERHESCEFSLTAPDAIVPPGGNTPALILYTSGTTGQPKGVLLSHANLASNTASIVHYLGLTAADSTVTVLPFYYSYGGSVLHTHLSVGARVVLERNLVYPQVIVEALARERVSGFAGVPSTYALLLSRVKLAEHDLSSLRYVTQAGGAMSPAVTQRLQAALPHASIFVMYGQTEATARLTYLPPARLKDKLGSAGIAIPGVRIEIRRSEGSVAAIDEVGEVWAAGANVMLGYWRNDAQSAEVKRDGWLKTGDMGRLDAEGFLYLVGRRSDMIKTGAHRVHPQDIEDVICELPEIQEACVIGVDDELLGQTIRAFVVPAAGAVLAPMQVQAHCRERLATYKVPKSVAIVASLPKTDSGKIRRAELK
jgi:acyl-CoA synthetase (AMP-forming)/AMP-acid ligase II